MENELNSELLKHVGEKVFLRRRQLDIKQNDLAKKAGVSQVLISMLERGASSMSLNKLEQITDALGLRLILDVTEANPTEVAEA